MTKKNDLCPNARIRPHRMGIFFSVLIKFIRMIIWLIFLLIVFSVLSEFLCHKSISEFLAERNFIISNRDRIAFYKQFYPIFNYNVILRTAELVGLVSILVTWVLQRIDKPELGIGGSELLDFICKRYYRLVAVHIISVVCCIWAAKNHQWELSCLSLLSIVLGLIVQGRVYYLFSFNSSARQKKAVEYYNAELDGLTKKEKTGEGYQHICGLISRISKQLDVQKIQDQDVTELIIRMLFDLHDYCPDNCTNKEYVLFLSQVLSDFFTSRKADSFIYMDCFLIGCSSYIKKKKIGSCFALCVMRLVFTAIFKVWRDASFVEAPQNQSDRIEYIWDRIVDMEKTNYESVIEKSKNTVPVLHKLFMIIDFLSGSTLISSDKLLKGMQYITDMDIVIKTNREVLQCFYSKSTLDVYFERAWDYLSALNQSDT